MMLGGAGNNGFGFGGSGGGLGGGAGSSGPGGSGGSGGGVGGAGPSGGGISSGGAGASGPAGGAEDGLHGRAERYLIFRLGTEEYAVAIRSVDEIIGLCPITRVPKTLPHVRGVVNLRGRILPVIDLHSKLSRIPVENERRRCIVVIRDDGTGAHNAGVGAIVDDVPEVMMIPESDIQESAAMNGAGQPGFVVGIARVGKRVILLLDVMKVLSDVDLEADADAELELGGAGTGTGTGTATAAAAAAMEMGMDLSAALGLGQGAGNAGSKTDAATGRPDDSGPPSTPR